MWQQQLCEVAAGGQADGPLEEAQHHKPSEEELKPYSDYNEVAYSKLRKADSERGSGKREINWDPRGMLLSCAQ